MQGYRAGESLASLSLGGGTDEPAGMPNDGSTKTLAQISAKKSPALLYQIKSEPVIPSMACYGSVCARIKNSLALAQ
jgi:hypothetical protein